jgi:hypothetical protein
MMRNPDDAVNYQKEIVRIVAEMQNEIGRGLRDYMDQLRTQATSSVEATASSAQAQSGDAAVNPVTSMFSVWETAFKEVADLAKKNMTAARSAAEGAAGRTVQTAQNAASFATDMANTSANEATRTVESAADAMTQAIRPEEGAGEDKKGTTTPPQGGKKK